MKRIYEKADADETKKKIARNRRIIKYEAMQYLDGKRAREIKTKGETGMSM